MAIGARPRHRRCTGDREDPTPALFSPASGGLRGSTLSPSRRTRSICSWSKPFETPMVPVDRNFPSPPVDVAHPPASRTRSPPAAMSQGLMPTTMLPSHFNVPPANMCTRAVQGRRRTHMLAAGPASQPRRAARPHSGPSGLGAGNVACTCDVLRKRFMGRTPLEDGPWADSYEKSPIQGFAFLLPASSACARSLLVPGTCDLTHRRTDASDSAAPWARNGPTIPAP
jgi:hypothetical protein